MTRLIHDKFAKDYFETLLEPFGKVNSQRRVSSEDQYVDVWFEPAQEHLAELYELGCLGRMAATPSIFEPFRNPVTPDEIGDCLLKSLLIKGELKRQARRNQSSSSRESIPKLWILTPTASTGVLSYANAVPSIDELSGFYTVGFRTTIVVIHQLPRTPETLWLRVLGRDRVQKQAIDELEVLSKSNPFRQRALELLYTLQKTLKSKKEIASEDRELIMRLEPLYQQEKEQLVREAQQLYQQEKEQLVREAEERVREAQQRGIEIGEERGVERGEERAQREIATNLLDIGMEIEQIAKATGLSFEEVTKLTNKDE